MNKILKASAGTGKTYRLSLEYIAALLEGEYFKEIVVMTFTRKATAEIRERIIEQIEDILAKGDNSDVFLNLKGIYPQISLDIEGLQEIYREMLVNKDEINIFTIDSFINKIFRETVAPYLGVYDYQIIDNQQNQEFIEGVFKQILDNPEDFAVMEKFLSANTERFIEPYLSLITEILNNRWKFLLINYQSRGNKSLGSLTDSLDDCLDILNNIAREKGKELSEDFYVKDFKNLMEDYGREELAVKKELIIKNQNLFFNKSFWNGSKVRGKKVADLRESLELGYEQFRQQLAAYIYNKEMLPYEEEVFSFSRRIFKIYDQLKFKEGAFTHADISNYTYKYFGQEELGLIANGEISDYFYEVSGMKVKSLFIDEFQDTSILQWKIIKPLLDRADKVITVGDEKQSIYGWRGGEKELFSRLDRILDSESESLKTCYRSEREIVDFINRFFLNLPVDWDYQGVDYLPFKNGGFLEVLIGGENTLINTETKAFQKFSQEKQAAVRELNQLIRVDLKREIAERIAELPSYSKVGILCRSNTDLVDIAAELDRAGIPYVLESKDSIIEHVAVKPLYFLLNHLLYNDYFQLLRFLRSDLAGINNRILKYLLQNRDKIESFMNGDDIVLEYEDLGELLKEIRVMKTIPYQVLTNMIIEKTGVIKYYSDNSAALRNIYYFFELMRGFNSLVDFITYLEENKDSDELKQLGVKGENVVSLMTIHKAKGLSFETEFFYWSPGGNRGGSSSSLEFYISFDQDFEEIENYLLTDTRYEKIFAYLGINFAEEYAERELMEEINNLYVALSRPERNLFFYIEGPRKLTVDAQGRCWGNSSYEFYEEALLAAVKLPSLCELAERKQFGKLIVSEDLRDLVDNKIPDLSQYFRPLKLTGEIVEETAEQKDYKMTLAKEIDRIEGLAVHYYLEHITYANSVEKDYAAKITKARYGNIMGFKRIEGLIRRIEEFIENNPLYFAEHWTVFTEYELSDGERTYRIDRLLLDEKAGEIMILDYKSGISREQSQLDKYKELVAIKTEESYVIKTEFLLI